MRVFIYQNTIINTDFAPRMDKLRKQGAWEMPEEQMRAVFGDKASMA